MLKVKTGNTVRHLEIDKLYFGYGKAVGLLGDRGDSTATR